MSSWNHFTISGQITNILTTVIIITRIIRVIIDIINDNKTKIHERGHINVPYRRRWPEEVSDRAYSVGDTEGLNLE